MVLKLRMGRGDADRTGLGIEALSVTVRTGDRVHVLFQLPDLRRAFAAAVLGQQVRDDSLPCATVLLRTFSAAPRKRDVPVLCAPQPNALLITCQITPRGIQQGAGFEFVDPLQCVRYSLIDMPLPAANVFPATDKFDATLFERETRVGDK